jgi:hypothetical protein
MLIADSPSLYYETPLPLEKKSRRPFSFSSSDPLQEQNDRAIDNPVRWGLQSIFPAGSTPLEISAGFRTFSIGSQVLNPFSSHIRIDEISSFFLFHHTFHLLTIVLILNSLLKTSHGRGSKANVREGFA